MSRLTNAEKAELYSHDKCIIIGPNVEELTHRMCADCRKVKPVVEFRRIRHRGLLLRCRVCEQRMDRQRYLIRIGK